MICSGVLSRIISCPKLYPPSIRLLRYSHRVLMSLRAPALLDDTYISKIPLISHTISPFFLTYENLFLCYFRNKDIHSEISTNSGDPSAMSSILFVRDYMVRIGGRQAMSHRNDSPIPSYLSGGMFFYFMLSTVGRSLRTRLP